MPDAAPAKKIKIMAAIPCFNTEAAIAHVVSEAKKYVDQVIVIDDGSHDGTAGAAQRAGAILVNHLVNRGYGEAIKSCFKAAKSYGAEILVTLDGDGQHKPEEIPLLLNPVLNEKADLIIGSRFIDRYNSVPRYRRFGIGVITLLWNFGSRTRVTDTQSGFRAYRKRLFEDLHLSEPGMSISIEILEKVRRKGATIKEVPIVCLYDHSRLNRKAFKHGLSVALAVVRIRFENTMQSLFSRNGKNASERLPVRESYATVKESPSLGQYSRKIR